MEHGVEYLQDKYNIMQIKGIFYTYRYNFKYIEARAKTIVIILVATSLKRAIIRGSLVATKLHVMYMYVRVSGTHTLFSAYGIK